MAPPLMCRLTAGTLERVGGTGWLRPFAPGSRSWSTCGADDDTLYFQHTLTEEPVMVEQGAAVDLAQGHDPVTELADPTTSTSSTSLAGSAGSSGSASLAGSAGSTGSRSLADLCGLAPDRVYLIGDRLAPRTVEEAVLEGLAVGARV